MAASIAKANGENLNDITLSRSTVRRKREFHRSQIASNIEQRFSALHNLPLVVHWDCKIMKDGTNLVDDTLSTVRMAVVVTGEDIEKILGIVKIPSSTGKSQANCPNIVDMSFDTVASNTVRIKEHVLD